MSMVSRSIWSDKPLNLTERESMLILLLETTRQVYSKNVVIITDRKDQVGDQDLGADIFFNKATNCLSLTSDHLSCVRELIWASFQS